MRLSNITRQPAKARVLYLKAMASLGNVDGTFSDEEISLLKQKISTFDVPEKYRDDILAGKILSSSELEEIFGYLKTKKLHHSFFLDMIAMAVSDGVLEYEEQQHLAKLQKLMGLTINAYYNLLHFAQLASQKTIEQLSDPMFFSSVLNMFEWAQEARVKLYHQTTFSIQHEVDEFLKMEYQS